MQWKKSFKTFLVGFETTNMEWANANTATNKVGQIKDKSTLILIHRKITWGTEKSWSTYSKYNSKTFSSMAIP